MGGKKINVAINTKETKKTISPYIYGLNGIAKEVTQTAARYGGNRLTGYNWVNNYSSAGGDWQHYNDDSLVGHMPEDKKKVPAMAITSFAEASVHAGAYPLVTIPMAGYVANDNLLAVSEEETAPSVRWAKVVDRKQGELTLEPDTKDGVVYSDELMNYLITKLGVSSKATGIKGYCLDNEPALWSETHARLHPENVTVDELVERTISLASVIKDFDAAAETFGPVLYGYGAFLTLQSAKDWESKYKKEYKWFIDCFLNKMKKAEDETGKRLLDVLDVHYYTEARSAANHRVSFDDDTGPDTVDTRVQSTRTLWDTEYRENSWLQKAAAEFLPVLPALNKSIAKYYPGTKLSITEYCFGAENHISGGIAQADTLGIFAEHDVYLAALWSLSRERAYSYSGINIYTNYDGKGGSFGDMLVSTDVDDKCTGSVYSSVNKSDDGTLHIVAINKDMNSSVDFNIELISDSAYSSADVYGFDSASPDILHKGRLGEIVGNKFIFSAEPFTVSHIILR